MTAKAWDMFTNKNAVNFLDTNADPNAVPLTLNDNVRRAYGEVTGSLQVINKGPGWSAYTNAGVQFNKEFETISLRGGVRYQW